jgi:hypothetical protein
VHEKRWRRRLEEDDKNTSAKIQSEIPSEIQIPYEIQMPVANVFAMLLQCLWNASEECQFGIVSARQHGYHALRFAYLTF